MIAHESTALNENTNDIEVYPNPTKDFINIKTNLKITSCKIIDLAGKVIAEYQGATKQINFQNGFLKGVYFLEINTEENNTFIKKIIIE